MFYFFNYNADEFEAFSSNYYSYSFVNCLLMFFVHFLPLLAMFQCFIDIFALKTLKLSNPLMFLLYFDIHS